MEIRCCMMSCKNIFLKNLNEKRRFYTFPKDFNLCMSWVQNCGRPELFEDFAFAGAQPFLNRHICSDHFNDADFVKKDPKMGLLPSSVPKLSLDFHKNDVKEEPVDTEFTNVVSKQILSKSDFTNGIKRESIRNDETTGNFSYSSTDDSCSDLNGTTLPIATVYEESKEEKQLSNEFFQKYQRAMFGARNTKQCRKPDETEQERISRLHKEALRAKIRRSHESEEEKKLRRMKNALRAAFRRRNETPQQSELRKRKDKLRSQMRRRAETDTETRIRRYNDAVRAAFRRNNETDQQRLERKMKDIVRAAKRRSMETPEQRTERLRKDRERASKRRMLKRITEQITQLDGITKTNGSQCITSSLSTASIRREDSNVMERFQQVLEFITNNAPKSSFLASRNEVSDISSRCAIARKGNDPKNCLVINKTVSGCTLQPEIVRI